ncbi:unnamed protein product [Dicrocoelium dendriticum]|nr:unnamed protein product [Dicrocoelium dendriticum]
MTLESDFLSNCTPSAFSSRQEDAFEDYIAVTEWEKFRQSIENILSRWELKADGDPTVRSRLLSSQTYVQAGYLCGRLHFDDREFHLVYYSGLQCSSPEDTARTDSGTPIFCAEQYFFTGHVVPPIAWFGLKRLLILRPSEGGITGGTRLNMLLSCVEIAVNTIKCPVPILVEYAGPCSSYLYGVAATASDFDSSALTDQTKYEYEGTQRVGSLGVELAVGQMLGTVHTSFTHLNGLREMFLRKLGYPLNASCSESAVQIAARFIYPLPFWPELTAFPEVIFPVFSFDVNITSSVFPLFHLSAVWPKVPAHAVSQNPSCSVLRPEGAPSWYLQLFLQTSHADRFSSRLKRIAHACCSPPAEDAVRVPMPPPTPITSRRSWLGADLPRLASMFRGPTMRHSPSSLSTELQMTPEQVIHYLLFLFPDADSSYSCSSAERIELMASTVYDNPNDVELLTWSRIQNRANFDVSSMASRLGLPPATSLAHRLAVLLCNLHFLQPNPSDFDAVHLIFTEVILELKLRLERLISLPDYSSYVDAETAVYPVPTSDPSIKASFAPVHLLPEEMQPFSHWSDGERLNIHNIFQRFDKCIETARLCSEYNSDSEATKSRVPEDPCDMFFDAFEQLPSTTESSPTPSKTVAQHAVDEARMILDWLQSLDTTQLLRCMIPSICLEALITLNSLVPPPRLHSFYRLSLEQLVCDSAGLLSRLDENMTQFDGYDSCEERFIATYYEVLTLLATFSSRFTCLRELLHDFTQHVNQTLSDECLAFLYDLSFNAVCGRVTWAPQLPGWIRIDRSSKAFTDFQFLFGVEEPPTNASSERKIHHFEFTSSVRRWFPTPSSLDLHQPTWETYILHAIVGQPNCLSSRPGIQRLYVALNKEERAQGYHCLLLASALSQDSQFF